MKDCFQFLRIQEIGRVNRLARQIIRLENRISDTQQMLR